MSKRERRERRKAEQQEKQRARQVKLGAAEPNPQKEPKATAVVDYEEQTVQWCFEIFDHGTDWRVNKNDDHDGFCAVGEHLKQYSQKTWREIRQNADRDHASDVDRLCRAAQKRLADLNMDDVDELWRFRFSARRRIWGIRDGRLFKVLWWDPDHQVYPTQPHNT